VAHCSRGRTTSSNGRSAKSVLRARLVRNMTA
jgi:hypothetical protein